MSQSLQLHTVSFKGQCQWLGRRNNESRKQGDFFFYFDLHLVGSVDVELEDKKGPKYKQITEASKKTDLKCAMKHFYYQ